MGKELIVFDLDGTLNVSKQPMDSEMSDLLVKLLTVKSVAVISGGSYAQFQKQFLGSLVCPDEFLEKLFLFPTCSTAFYRRQGGRWKQVYVENLSPEEKGEIFAAFEKAFEETNYKKPEKVYGDVIEDRGTQITFSALGQQAPPDVKAVWDPDAKKRQVLRIVLLKYIPEFEIRIGGMTSVDVTRKGIDKAYGIRQIQKYLGFRKEQILFVGDALFEGGNDCPVKAEGIECIAVSGPEQTKKVIEAVIKAS